MSVGEKLYQLRKQKYLSQDELARALDVSRQSISKWELDQSYPDIDNLIKLSQFFEVPIDFIVKDEYDPAESNLNDCQSISDDIPNSQNSENQAQSNKFHFKNKFHYEYKSKTTVGSLPLLHINIGSGFYKAKGIIAIGSVAKGIIAIGGISFGIFSLGGICIGIIALGGISMGIIVAVGGIAVSSLASVGSVALGAYSVGCVAIGYFKAVGCVAISPNPLGLVKVFLNYKIPYNIH